MNNEEKLVQIAEFQFPYQGEIARIELEESNIHCVLLDGQADGPVMGGVLPTRLEVFEADAAEARRILREKELYVYDEPGDGTP